MSDGPFWSEIGLIMQKLSEADRVTLIQRQRKSEDAVRAEALDMGRRIERERVVAWLRGMLWRSSSDHINALSKSIGDEVAAAIERGEHEKGSGE